MAPPTAPALNHVMNIIVDLGPAWEVGPVPDGFRRIIPIIGGSFKGELLSGVVMPLGADWNMVRNDEVMTARAEYLLKTDDDVYIGIHNTGIIRGGAGVMDKVIGKEFATEGLYTRIATRFEAPLGKYDWLNKSFFIGVLIPPEDLTKITMDVYELA